MKTGNPVTEDPQEASSVRVDVIPMMAIPTKKMVNFTATENTTVHLRLKMFRRPSIANPNPCRMGFKGMTLLFV